MNSVLAVLPQPFELRPTSSTATQLIEIGEDPLPVADLDHAVLA
jgi:hypothetical protein